MSLLICSLNTFVLTGPAVSHHLVSGPLVRRGKQTASLVPLKAASNKLPTESSKWESVLAQSTCSISSSHYTLQPLSPSSPSQQKNCRRTIHPAVGKHKSLTTKSTKHTPEKVSAGLLKCYCTFVKFCAFACRVLLCYSQWMAGAWGSLCYAYASCVSIRYHLQQCRAKTTGQSNQKNKEHTAKRAICYLLKSGLLIYFFLPHSLSTSPPSFPLINSTVLSHSLYLLFLWSFPLFSIHSFSPLLSPHISLNLQPPHHRHFY